MGPSKCDFELNIHWKNRLHLRTCFPKFSILGALNDFLNWWFLKNYMRYCSDIFTMYLCTSQLWNEQNAHTFWELRLGVVRIRRMAPLELSGWTQIFLEVNFSGTFMSFSKIYLLHSNYKSLRNNNKNSILGYRVTLTDNFENIL